MAAVAEEAAAMVEAVVLVTAVVGPMVAAAADTKASLFQLVPSSQPAVLPDFRVCAPIHSVADIHFLPASHQR